SPNRKRRRGKVVGVIQQAHGRSSCLKRVKLPFPACTMHACGLQDFQMVRIFPPDKLEMGVRMSAMHARISLLYCIEPFTPRTRRRELRVIDNWPATVHLSRKNQAHLKDKTSAAKSL